MDSVGGYFQYFHCFVNSSSQINDKLILSSNIKIQAPSAEGTGEFNDF